MIVVAAIAVFKDPHVLTQTTDAIGDVFTASEADPDAFLAEVCPLSQRIKDRDPQAYQAAVAALVRYDGDWVTTSAVEAADQVRTALPVALSSGEERQIATVVMGKACSHRTD